MHVCSGVSDSATPWSAAHQAPLPMEVLGQECWSGLPFPTLEDLPDLGIKLHLLHPFKRKKKKIKICDIFYAIVKNS